MDAIELLDQNRRVAWAKYYDLARAVREGDFDRARRLAQTGTSMAAELDHEDDLHLGGRHLDLEAGEHFGALVVYSNTTPPHEVGAKAAECRAALNRARKGR